MLQHPCSISFAPPHPGPRTMQPPARLCPGLAPRPRLQGPAPAGRDAPPGRDAMGQGGLVPPGRPGGRGQREEAGPPPPPPEPGPSLGYWAPPPQAALAVWWGLLAPAPLPRA